MAAGRPTTPSAEALTRPPVLALLHKISFRYFRESRGRTALIVGGITTGVSLVVAIDIINASVLENFRRTLELIAGPSHLEVTLGVGEVGFDEALVETMRADRAVRTAVPLVRGSVSLAEHDHDVLQLFGVDWTAEQDLARYPITTRDRETILRNFGDPRAILVTTVLAEMLGVVPGDPVRLSTASGLDDYTVRGVLDTQGAASVFGGRLVIMDLPAAQLAMAKPGLIDQIDVVLRDGASVDEAKARLASALPESLNVRRPLQRAEQYENILASFQTMLTGLSLLCLVAGLYIVYNTTSTAAARRALSIAQLRLIGAEPATVLRLLLFEAAVLGTIGTGIGVPFGIGLAWLLTGMVSESMGIIFHLRFPLEALTVDPTGIAIASTLGITITLLASMSAAFRVARLEPVETMRLELRRVTPPTAVGWFVAAWLVLALVTIAALVAEVEFKSAAWGNFASTLWFASSIVIAIPLVSVSGRLLSRSLARLAGSAGRVAAESLFRSPVRTGVTVAALTLVLTVAVTIACLVESLRMSTGRYYKDGGFLVGDLVVSAISTQGGWLETPLPESVGEALKAVAGVRSVGYARAMPGQPYKGERVMMLGLTDGMLSLDHYGAAWYRRGDPKRAERALQAGEGANISVSFADRFDLAVGDHLELDAPTGPLTLPVVGIVYDYMSDGGTITLSRDLFVTRWADTSINRFSVYLDPSADPARVRRDIAASLAGKHRVKILSATEMVEYHERMIDRAFAFTDAIVLLVAIVTVAGIFDLLVSAIIERKRELALWRLIGADDRTVHLSVIIESATIGGLGAMLGIVMGLVTAWTWVGIHFRYLVGFYLDFHFATAEIAGQVALVMAMAIAAGYAASRFATRLSVLDSIESE